MRRRIWVLVLIFGVAVPVVGQAATKQFVEQYTYAAGEADSKLTCRTVSLLEIKRLLLERLGTYLQTQTTVKNFQVTNDEIVSVSAGIVKTQILEERWTGETYSLIAKIEADPEEVTRAIQTAQQQPNGINSSQRLEEINAESIEQIRDLQAQMGQLQDNLLKVNQDMQANKGLLDAWGMYEKGARFQQIGKPREAVDALTQAIGANPTQLAYYYRGKAYLELKQYPNAVDDFTAALRLEPAMRGALQGRSNAYWLLGQKREARRDMKRAAELGAPRAKKWLKHHSINRDRW